MIKKAICITTGIIAALASNAGDLSRADIDAKLKELADKPAPTKLAPGAMCYDMVMPPNRIEYVCPACGTKTILQNNGAVDKTEWILPKVESYRNQALELQKLGLNIKLDESSLCQKCSGKTNSSPKLYWIIKIENEERKIELQDEDASILKAFIKGQDRLHTQVQETPLKNHIKRLEELLGKQSGSNGKEAKK